MHRRLQGVIGTILLSTNFFQTGLAALPVDNTGEEMSQHFPYFLPNEMENLRLFTHQFGLAEPIIIGIHYINLSGVFFNGQFFGQLREKLCLNVQEEYGDNQYHVNGTTGFLLGAQHFLKISTE